MTRKSPGKKKKRFDIGSLSSCTNLAVKYEERWVFLLINKRSLYFHPPSLRLIHLAGSSPARFRASPRSSSPDRAIDDLPLTPTKGLPADTESQAHRTLGVLSLAEGHARTTTPGQFFFIHRPLSPL